MYSYCAGDKYDELQHALAQSVAFMADCYVTQSAEGGTKITTGASCKFQRSFVWFTKIVFTKYIVSGVASPSDAAPAEDANAKIVLHTTADPHCNHCKSSESLLAGIVHGLLGSL